MEFLWMLAKIMGINIVLSGDNAVVIAMASRCLPARQQKLAILWGSFGAIVLRVALTLIAVKLLEIPYLQFAGGLLLVWIAAKLLIEDNHGEEIEASSSLWAAIKTIIIADVVMSLDNTMAIAGVAKGDLLLLCIGLGLSIPLIIFGSSILVALMERFPIIIYAGAALIAWTAGEMIIDDEVIGEYILQWVPQAAVPAFITTAVVAFGYRKHKRAEGNRKTTDSAKSQ